MENYYRNQILRIMASMEMQTGKCFYEISKDAEQIDNEFRDEMNEKELRVLHAEICQLYDGVITFGLARKK